jgi:hypothetical protein
VSSVRHLPRFGLEISYQLVKRPDGTFSMVGPVTVGTIPMAPVGSQIMRIALNEFNLRLLKVIGQKLFYSTELVAGVRQRLFGSVQEA